MANYRDFVPWWMWVGVALGVVWLGCVVWDQRHAEERRRRARQLAAKRLEAQHQAARSTRQLRRMHIGGYSPGWWGRMLREHGYTCYYCKRHLPKQERFHKEHDIPLVRGGRHHVENIKPACATCNLRKGRKTGAEFLEAIAANGGKAPPTREEWRTQRPPLRRTSAREEVLAAMTALGQGVIGTGWSVDEIVTEARRGGSTRPLGSLRATISTMGTEGQLVRVSRGKYRLP